MMGMRRPQMPGARPPMPGPAMTPGFNPGGGGFPGYNPGGGGMTPGYNPGNFGGGFQPKIAYPSQPPPGMFGGGFGGGGGAKVAYPAQPPPGAFGGGGPMYGNGGGFQPMGPNFGGGFQPMPGAPTDAMMHPFAPRNRMQNALLQGLGGGGMRYL